MPCVIVSKRRANSASADDLECLANSGGEKDKTLAAMNSRVLFGRMRRSEDVRVK